MGWIYLSVVCTPTIKHTDTYPHTWSKKRRSFSHVTCRCRQYALHVFRGSTDPCGDLLTGRCSYTSILRPVFSSSVTQCLKSYWISPGCCHNIVVPCCPPFISSSWSLTPPPLFSCSYMKRQPGWWQGPVPLAHISSWIAPCEGEQHLEPKQVRLWI